MKTPNSLLSSCLRTRLSLPVIAGVALALFASSTSCPAQIWRRGSVIPGTEEITIGPGVDLSGWNTESRNLRYAEGFSGYAGDGIGIDLTGANFSNSWLDGVAFTTRVWWIAGGSTIPEPPPEKGTEVNNPSTLAEADFTGAVVIGTDFGGTTKSGFTPPQLYSTKSYQEKNLQGVSLDFNELTGWSFRDQNLSNANFFGSTLTDVDLTGAVVTGADFAGTEAPQALTEAQLYSTQSYRDKDLRGVWFSPECSECGWPRNDLTGWDFRDQDLRGSVFSATRLQGADFSGANLTNADLRSSTLTDVDLTGARLARADLGKTTNFGFTSEQLYSTKSYQEKHLQGIRLDENDMSGWDFRGQDLSGANLRQATLEGADLTGATVTGVNLHAGKLKGANFADANLTDAYLRGAALKDVDLTGAKVTGASFSWTTRSGFGSPAFAGFGSFTPEQLYSTSSYQEKNLQGINLGSNDLDGWGFRKQDLTNASLGGSTLKDVDLTGAIVTGTHFGQTTSSGFTSEQLYSTKSYQQRNLQGIDLRSNDLTGWNFRDQDLSGAVLAGSTLTDVDLTGATISGGDFSGMTDFTSQQLYSTTDYQEQNLQGINLRSNDLTGWNFQNQDLTGANFDDATVTDADLTGATISGANFWGTAGFTSEQLYSTKSYQDKNLEGIALWSNDMTGWNFRGQSLVGASFSSATLESGDFSDANLTNADLWSSKLLDADFTGANLTNADLRHADVETVNVTGTTYNQWTQFPSDFDPIAAGMTFVATALGDFDANNVLDVRDFELLNQRVTLGSERELAWLTWRMFDLDGDGYLTAGDQDVWLTDVKQALPGDADLNGKVEFADFLVLSENFGNAGSWTTGDFDLSGDVQFADFLLFSENFGRSETTTIPVPEPFSMGLASLGLIGVLCSRRRP